MVARILTVCLICTALAGCGSSPKREDAAGASPSDPPGVAEKLSLGGQAQAEPAGSYQGAVNCAVALRVTTRTLQTMSTGEGTEEMRLIAGAAETYRKRALAAVSASERRVTADISRGLQQNESDPGRQAQLAIACLRALDPHVG